MDFVVKEPFFKTIAQSSQSGIAVAGSSGGTATNFGVTYNGSIWATPVWQLNIPGGNAVSLSQLKLQNTTSGETLTVPLSVGSGAHTIVVDSSAFTVTVDGTQRWL
jgi:hypothetical protein